MTSLRPSASAIGSSNLRLQPDEPSDISLALGYVVRFTSMTSQAFSASANVLKGDPPTLMTGLLKLMGRQEATKPGRPCRPGPLLLSLPDYK